MEYAWIFVLCFLSASILPAASEPYYMVIVAKYNSLLLPVIFATVGNTLGGLTTFLIGRKGGEIALKRMSGKNQKRYDRAVNFINKFGPAAMLISWIPVLGDVVVTLGGALKLPVAASLFWMTIGKFGRYILLGLTAIGIWKGIGN